MSCAQNTGMHPLNEIMEHALASVERAFAPPTVERTLLNEIMEHALASVERAFAPPTVERTLALPSTFVYSSSSIDSSTYELPVPGYGPDDLEVEETQSSEGRRHVVTIYVKPSVSSGERWALAHLRSQSPVASAKVRNGLLTLTFEAPQKPKARQIPVSGTD